MLFATRVSYRNWCDFNCGPIGRVSCCGCIMSHYNCKSKSCPECSLEGIKRTLEFNRRLEIIPKICSFCYNMGNHLCPDVAEPILIKCTNKKCRV